MDTTTEDKKHGSLLLISESLEKPSLQHQIRKIIHLDMDCFYAAIEVRDNSSLKGKPVAVGGFSNQRGVLCTCNYEARKYGLHSAMPTARAMQLCPKLVLVPVNMQKYKAVSFELKKIFQNYTSIIEFLSLDEAFLDVTGSEISQGSATLIAESIRQEIKNKQELTASAGISTNKFLAKVASEWRKPDGLFVIRPEDIAIFIKKLPINKISGVGPVTAQKIFNLGIQTCGELQSLSLTELMLTFGSFGARLYKLCRGIDEREVETEREHKSISVEETYDKDLATPMEGIAQLPELLQRLKQRLAKVQKLQVAKIYVKIKFNDFSHTTIESSSMKKLEISSYEELLRKGYLRQAKPIRLIGLGVRLQPIQISRQLIIEGLVQ